MNKYEFYSTILQEDFPVKYREVIADNDSEQRKEIRELREALARVEAELNAKPADDLAQACIAQLIESGAENYTEHHFGFVRDGEDVERPAVVTVQFSDRPSPHELRIKAETERDTARSQLAEAVGFLRSARYLNGDDLEAIDDFILRHTQTAEVHGDEKN